MTEDEKYVREHVDVAVDTGHPGRWLRLGCLGTMCEAVRESDEAGAWSKAAEVVRTRLEQIRDVEEEIEYVESFRWIPTRSSKHEEHPVWSRILAREQAALADLKRGLRVAEERTER